MSKISHEFDQDGHYCYSWCKACEAYQILCAHCGSQYGEYQYHSPDKCNEFLQKEKDKQLKFPFFV